MPKIEYEKTTKVTATTYTLLGTDEVLLVDASSSAITINLHSVVAFRGKVVTITKIDNSSNEVTLTPNGIETLASESGNSIKFENNSIRLLADGISNWEIISTHGMVVGDLDLDGNIIQTVGGGDNTFADDVIIAGDLTVDLTSTLTGDVACGEDVTIALTLVVGTTNQGVTTINGNLSVTGANTFNVETGASSLGGILTVTGLTTLNDDVTIALNKDLDLSSSGTGTFTMGTGLATFGGAMNISGAVEILGNTDFTLSSTTGTGAFLMGDGTFTKGDGTFTTGTGLAAFGGDVTIVGTLEVTGLATFNGGIDISTTDLSVTGTLTVAGLTTLSGGLTIATATAVTLSGTATLSIGGITTLSDDVTIAAGKDLDLSSGGDGTFIMGTGTFTIGTGLATFGGDVDIVGDLDVGGDFIQPVTITQTLTVTGNAIFGDSVLLGNSSRIAFAPSAQDIDTGVGDVIIADSTFIILSNSSGADRILTTDPPVSVTSIEDGALIIIQGHASMAKTVTLTSTAAFSLGSATRTIDVKDTLVLVYNGTSFVEISFTNHTP